MALHHRFSHSDPGGGHSLRRTNNLNETSSANFRQLLMHGPGCQFGRVTIPAEVAQHDPGEAVWQKVCDFAGRGDV